MKKYVTVLTIAIAALVFSGTSWADSQEDDSLYGNRAVVASKGTPYVRSESRSNEQGTDLLSNPKDYSSSSASEPAIPADSSHDDHEDVIHAITKH